MIRTLLKSLHRLELLLVVDWVRCRSVVSRNPCISDHSDISSYCHPSTAFKVPSAAASSRDTTSRKRNRVVYAESGGFYDDAADADHDPHAEKKSKKVAAALAKKVAGGDDSDDDGKKKLRPGQFVDKYVPPPPPKQFPVFRPKPFDAVVAGSFKLPGIKRKGQILELRLTGKALGVRKPITVIPRPLHNPLLDHAIVLWDPTIDDREVERELERERLAQTEREKDKEGQKVLDDSERERAKTHRSLAEMLGLVAKGGPKRVAKVPVVIDPRVGKVLRPHQVEGVKFLYRCVTGMVDETAQGYA